MIAFKSPELISEWDYVHPVLRQFLIELDNHWLDPYLEITRIGDDRSVAALKAIGQTGIHSNQLHPKRAVDFRTKDNPEDDVNRVIAFVVLKYQYDPERPGKPFAYQHRFRGGTIHGHAQAHANSRRIEGA